MLAILHPALLFRERDHAPPHCGAAFTPSGMGEAGVVGGSLYSQLAAMHAEPKVRIRLLPADRIAAAAKAMAKRGAPNPEVRADSERPIAVHKEEPLTDAKSAARARRKANKNKRRAEQAEASAAEARENLNKGADMDSMVIIAKSVIAGKPSTFTKQDFFVELQKRADQNQRPGETREKAFARYATTDPNGQVLMQAHKAATGDDYSGEPVKAVEGPTTPNDAYRRLMDLANEQRRGGETVEQAFARLYADPKHRDLVTTEKRMHTARVAKAAVGVA
jgi:hypothetical protein